MPPEVHSRQMETMPQASSHPAMGDLYRPLRALLVLSKPRIVATELLAGLAGAFLSSPGTPAAHSLMGLTICLGLTAAGAAMANCLLETDSDLLMKRYAPRSEALETVGGKNVLTVLLLLGGSGITLALPLCNQLTAVLLALAFFCYVEIYTAGMKRRTPWSVLVGGIPGALPPLIGAAATESTITMAPLLLGLLIYLWQLPHFWLLALQHRREYVAAGIPVLPVVLGERSTGRLILFCAFCLIPYALVFSLSAGHPPIVTILLVGAAVAFARRCHEVISLTRDYRNAFVASLAYLGATLLLVIVSSLIAIVP
jgi:protoheme IX farnesyltransferase